MTVVSSVVVPSAPRAPSAADPRRPWLGRRLAMEDEFLRTGWCNGRKRRRFWTNLMVETFRWATALCGLYRTGLRNAEDLQVRDLELTFPRLPEAFDGLTILHLSDLHADGMPHLADRVIEALGARKADLCVLTGDYTHRVLGPPGEAAAALVPLLRELVARQPTVGVLGNHDSARLVAPMEAVGVRMLVNERLRLWRGAESILLAGTDDVRFFRTPGAEAVLTGVEEDFCIALVHSPEMYDLACATGVDLYLCGHTHGGQVCRPDGRAVVMYVDRGREFCKGHWRSGGMQGVTHCGVGTSGAPLRFHCPPEILFLHLRRA